ncbi:MAG: hypothetical protein ABIY55_14720 [Kofleriaceae bacterium]
MRVCTLLLVLAATNSASAAPPALQGIRVVQGQSADLVRRGVETQLGPVRQIRCKDESIVRVTRLRDRLRFFGLATGSTRCDYDYGGLQWHVDVVVVTASRP